MINYVYNMVCFCFFFFSSRRRHTRCALVTGVQTCALPISARTNLQLFRQSVKERQRALLETSLRSLETAALTARSGTSDEARLRQQEADLILRWVDRATKIEPSGQVVISQSDEIGDLLLANGERSEERRAGKEWVRTGNYRGVRDT